MQERSASEAQRSLLLKRSADFLPQLVSRGPKGNAQDCGIWDGF